MADDNALQAHLGHTPELTRKFSSLSMLGLAFAILNSWTALAASLSLALPSGGPTSVIWGLIVAGICNLCLAASLSEFLSAWPTAGGQYHWVALISWPSYKPLLSWICGWINVGGWIALSASGGLLGSQLITETISFMHPSYVSHSWHQFLIYIGFILLSFLINAFLTILLPKITKGAFIWSITGFTVICITVLATASPNYNSGDFVFRTFLNTTGWPNGIAWLLGLLQAGFGLTGFDSVAHMIEEIPNPAVEGPKIMIGCVAIGVFTGFIFLVILLFVGGGVDDMISATEGPLLRIFHVATGSRVGSVCLLVFPLVCLLFASISIMTTSSRMTYAFARDGGLPASRHFAKVHKRLDVPLNALYLTTALIVIFGCIFLGSSSAFNAIISASVVALGVSYGFPVVINCLRGRKMLPSERPFVLPGMMGWLVNLIGIAYVIITTVLFVFPPALPVTGSNMNYCLVAFFIWLVISTVQWFVDGRKNFNGPKIELATLQNGDLVGQPVDQMSSASDGTAGLSGKGKDN